MPVYPPIIKYNSYLIIILALRMKNDFYLVRNDVADWLNLVLATHYIHFVYFHVDRIEDNTVWEDNRFLTRYFIFNPHFFMVIHRFLLHDKFDFFLRFFHKWVIRYTNFYLPLCLLIIFLFPINNLSDINLFSTALNFLSNLPNNKKWII